MPSIFSQDHNLPRAESFRCHNPRQRLWNRTLRRSSPRVSSVPPRHPRRQGSSLSRRKMEVFVPVSTIGLSMISPASSVTLYHSFLQPSNNSDELNISPNWTSVVPTTSSAFVKGTNGKRLSPPLQGTMNTLLCRSGYPIVPQCSRHLSTMFSETCWTNG